MTRSRHRRPGLTLLEVLLVMAILILLSAVAYPTLSGLYGDVRVKAAADQVQATWAEGRARAIEDGRAYRYAVQPGTGKFRLAPDGPGFADGSGGGPADENAPPPYVEEGELTKPILFDVPADLPADGSWTTVVLFNPDGSCSHDVEITLKDDDDSTPIAVRVRAMTGAVTVRQKLGGDR